MDLEKRIARILRHSGNEWSVSDLLQKVDSKQLILLEKNGVLLIAEVQAYPQKRILHIWGLEGESALESLLAIVEWCKELARALDCVELRCQGRKGWERALRPAGASVLYTTLSMDV